MAKQAAKKSAKKAVKRAGKKAAKKTTRTRTSKRELINTGIDKRFVRRSAGGEFKESDDVGRSLAADQRTQAKTRVKSGQGDKGDR